MPARDGQTREQERRLRKDLGFWGLTAIGFSTIVGSGWLFAALYAAQIAGPVSLVSWVAAGALCALIALVTVELGATRPEGGGTVRRPLYASGRLVGTVIGWSVLLSVGGTAAEISRWHDLRLALPLVLVGAVLFLLLSRSCRAAGPPSARSCGTGHGSWSTSAC